MGKGKDGQGQGWARARMGKGEDGQGRGWVRARVGEDEGRRGHRKEVKVVEGEGKGGGRRGSPSKVIWVRKYGDQREHECLNEWKGGAFVGHGAGRGGDLDVQRVVWQFPERPSACSCRGVASWAGSGQ